MLNIPVNILTPPTLVGGLLLWIPHVTHLKIIFSFHTFPLPLEFLMTPSPEVHIQCTRYFQKTDNFHLVMANGKIWDNIKYIFFNSGYLLSQLLCIRRIPYQYKVNYFCKLSWSYKTTNCCIKLLFCVNVKIHVMYVSFINLLWFSFLPNIVVGALYFSSFHIHYNTLLIVCKTKNGFLILLTWHLHVLLFQ